jgi:hypothetical protein
MWSTKNITRALKVAASLLGVSKRKLRAEYDENTDILYVNVSRKQRANRRLAFHDNVILVSNGSLLGVSFLDADQRVPRELRFDSKKEWEGLQQNYQITTLMTVDDLPPGSETIEVGRDDSYDIVGKVSGVFTDYLERTRFFLPGVVYGSEVPRFDIEGSDERKGDQYMLRGCSMGGVRQTSGVRTGPFEGWVSAPYVHKRKNKDSETSRLTEWCLNGPQDPVYTRVTARTVESPFERRRIFPHNQQAIQSDVRQQRLDLDFFFVDLPNLSFVVHKVPQECGPQWSRNIGIEYTRDWGIPDESRRELIREVLGFILGRPLLNVGHTMFDQSNDPVEEVSRDPGWPLGRTLVELCQSGDYSPIRIREVGIENVLQKIAPAYLALREDLNLHEALWRYWLAKSFPLGTDIPVLAAAVEGLATSWFKSRTSETKGVYMPKKDFDQLLEDEFRKIYEKLEDLDYAERIMNRLRGAYNMGLNERPQFFFDEINLPIGEIENAAIRSRNKPAHGSSLNYSDEEREKVTKLRLRRSGEVTRVCSPKMAHSFFANQK